MGQLLCKVIPKKTSIFFNNQIVQRDGVLTEISNDLNFYEACLSNDSKTCGLNPLNLFFSRKKLFFIDQLVLDTLNVIKTLFDYEREVPQSMVKLQVLADFETGWLCVINSMINIIPIDESLGPSVILLLIEGWALPTKESIYKLSDILVNIDQNNSKLSFNLNKCGCKKSNFVKNICKSKVCNKKLGYAKHRNFCVILACLAEKLAGPNSVILMTDTVLSYLISNLNLNYEPIIILFSLIALEKFSQTNENKERIREKLENKFDILYKLETWFDEEDYIKHQVGFCVQWTLDNIFIFNTRAFTYERQDNSNLNVILNSNDASEYLKISANGLYARCDASLFESVRSTFQIDEGVWFYEVTIITSGVMQIGFATKNSKFLSDEGNGIGDDIYSVAYDGCRQVVWYDSKSISHKNIQKSWSVGDTLGCLIDLINQKIVFYLNGEPLPPFENLFKYAKQGFYAAGSFMSFQECKFNFGSSEFKYPPKDIEFKAFNDYGVLDKEEKKIYPKFKRRDLIHFNSKDNSCTLCYDQQATTRLLPCNHSDFCLKCAMQIEFCPLCRSDIKELENIPCLVS